MQVRKPLLQLRAADRRADWQQWPPVPLTD
jgi:hypothetical protein